MSADIHTFPSHKARLSDLQRQHAGCIGTDIALIAKLVIAGHEKGEDLHSAFVRHLSAARLFNREALPNKPIDTERLFIDANCGNDALFVFDMEDAKVRPMLSAKSPWTKQEIISRVVWDTSSYLRAAGDWLFRNRDNETIRNYTVPANALKLVQTIPALEVAEGTVLVQRVEEAYTKLGM
ncbi:MAG: hypothetical protein ACK4NR_02090 [Micavibrio sp.]